VEHTTKQHQNSRQRLYLLMLGRRTVQLLWPAAQLCYSSNCC
jgi:hypothetical protein